MGSGDTVPTSTPVARSRIHRPSPPRQRHPLQSPHEGQHGPPPPQPSTKVLFDNSTNNIAATKRYKILKKKRNYGSMWIVATMAFVVAIASGGCFVVVSFVYTVTTIIGSVMMQPQSKLQQQISSPLLNIPHSNTLTNLRSSSLNSDVYHTAVNVHDVAETGTFNYDVPVTLLGSDIDRLPDPVFVPFPSHQFIILVMSQRSHHQRRTLIRRTWGRTYTKSLLFVIGGEPINTTMRHRNDDRDTSLHGPVAVPEERRRLLEEQNQHHDMLDTIHPESYRSLPHKLRFAVHWVTTKMKQEQSTSSMIQWILKVDDDMYLRDLHHFTARSSAEQSLVPLANVPIVMGCIQYDVVVQRSGKWAEDTWFYERHPIYPPWPKGSCGYVLNHVVANIITEKYNQDIRMMIEQEQLLSRAVTSIVKDVMDGSGSHSTRTSHGDPQPLYLPSHQGEDTSFGIWLQHSNISWIDSPFFVNNGNCDMLPRLKDDTLQRTKLPRGLETRRTSIGSGTMIENRINEVTIPWCIGHRMTPEQMQYCYDTEHVYINNHGKIPYSPLEYDMQQQLHHVTPDNVTRDTSTTAAYTVAMMRHEADQKRLRRQEEMEERRQRRQRKIKQLQNNDSNR